MSKLVYGKNGVIVNIVNVPATPSPEFDGLWLVADGAAANLGDAFDPKDPQIDAMDVGVFRILFRHENLIRELIRTIRTNSALNTQATTAGLPTTGNSPDLTLAQARDAFKALLP